MFLTPHLSAPARKISRFACIFISTLSLYACATQPHVKTSLDTTLAPEEDGVSAEFVFKYLTGELAGQRGDLSTAGAIFYDLAKTTQDARLAERAARTAAYANIPKLAIPATKLWADLDPEAIAAQQAMTEMLVATERIHDAEPFLAKLLLNENSRANGFLTLHPLLNRSKNKQAVLDVIQSLAQPYPNLAEAQFAIAQAAITANQPNIALQRLDLAATLKPGWAMAARLKGQILAEQSPKTALDFYQKFLDAYPEAMEVQLTKARLLVDQKRYDLAKDTLVLVTQQAKNDPDIFVVAGLLSFQGQDYVVAEQYLQQALLLNFKNTDQIYLYLAQIAEKQHHDSSAVTWYNKISVGPYYLEAQLNLADITARTQSVDAAIQQLDVVDHLTPEQQIVVIQAQAALLIKNQRNQEAFDLLKDAVKNAPNTTELIYDYALAAERVQKLDIMEAELRRVIAIKPNFAAAYNALGYSFAERNIRLNEALKLIEKALTLAPQDHYMLDSLGWVYYRKGKLDQAENYLQQAYKINQDPEIAAHLGEVLWKKNQRDEAERIWQEALTLHPDNEILLNTTQRLKH